MFLFGFYGSGKDIIVIENWSIGCSVRERSILRFLYLLQCGNVSYVIENKRDGHTFRFRSTESLVCLITPLNLLSDVDYVSPGRCHDAFTEV